MTNPKQTGVAACAVTRVDARTDFSGTVGGSGVASANFSFSAATVGVKAKLLPLTPAN